MHPEGANFDRWPVLLTNPSASSDATVVHLIIISLCLLAGFRSRGHPAGLILLAGIAILLIRQLSLLLLDQNELQPLVVSIDPATGILIGYATLLTGLGLVGVGLSYQMASADNTPSIQLLGLTALFFALACFELVVLADRVIRAEGSSVLSTFQNASLIAALLTTLSILHFKRKAHVEQRQHSEQVERQLVAMMSMFRAVKHDLNNDMQVILGNAELTETLASVGGDWRKPINNVSAAAGMAVERIQQLSAFSTNRVVTLAAIDLNSVLSECAEKLSAELPSTVAMHQNLALLESRVMADRYLLSLSIIHLIRQAVKTMDIGGVIVLTTYNEPDVSSGDQKPSIICEIQLQRSMQPFESTSSSVDQDHLLAHQELVELSLNTTKALVERSGAISVGHSVSLNESTIRMGFVSEHFSERPVKPSSQLDSKPLRSPLSRADS